MNESPIQIADGSRWQDPLCIDADHFLVRAGRLKRIHKGNELYSNHSMEWFGEQVKLGKLVPCDERGKLIPQIIGTINLQ